MARTKKTAQILRSLNLSASSSSSSGNEALTLTRDFPNQWMLYLTMLACRMLKILSWDQPHAKMEMLREMKRSL
jgi:hypothetical protein